MLARLPLRSAGFAVRGRAGFSGAQWAAWPLACQAASAGASVRAPVGVFAGVLVGLFVGVRVGVADCLTRRVQDAEAQREAGAPALRFDGERRQVGRHGQLGRGRHAAELAARQVVGDVRDAGQSRSGAGLPGDEAACLTELPRPGHVNAHSLRLWSLN